MEFERTASVRYLLFGRGVRAPDFRPGGDALCCIPDVDAAPAGKEIITSRSPRPSSPARGLGDGATTGSRNGL
jgi:hypothetical protein